jgi:hypothetical protein
LINISSRETPSNVPTKNLEMIGLSPIKNYALAM